MSNSMVQDINKARNVRFSSPEINDMYLVWEELSFVNEHNKQIEEEMIMMVCSNSNEYMVYDERDTEQSTLLRRVTGGHQTEISCMAYDFHLSLVATGSVGGTVVVYDFEMSRVLGILDGHDEAIISLMFLSPYPILVSTSFDCTVCIWYVRSGIQEFDRTYMHDCVRRFKNSSFSPNGDDDRVPVTKMTFSHHQDITGIKKYRRIRNPAQKLNALSYRNFAENFAFSIKPVDQMYEEQYPLKPGKRR